MVDYIDWLNPIWSWGLIYIYIYKFDIYIYNLIYICLTEYHWCCISSFVFSGFMSLSLTPLMHWWMRLGGISLQVGGNRSPVFLLSVCWHPRGRSQVGGGRSSGSQLSLHSHCDGGSLVTTEQSSESWLSTGPPLTPTHEERREYLVTILSDTFLEKVLWHLVKPHKKIEV